MKRIGDIMREHIFIIVALVTTYGLIVASYFVLCWLGYNPSGDLHDNITFMMTMFPAVIIGVFAGIAAMWLEIKREDKKKIAQK